MVRSAPAPITLLASPATQDAAPTGSAYAATFLASELVVEQTATPSVKPPLDDTLRFGRTFTDHMLRVRRRTAAALGQPAPL